MNRPLNFDRALPMPAPKPLDPAFVASVLKRDGEALNRLVDVLLKRGENHDR